MRRDVCYFFPTDVTTLYNAYLAAAKNPPFERSCCEEPYHTFSFGLNFSMKYNMNGGSCTLHFIRCQGGSAVDLRFAIAQLAGARYEKYADYLTEKATELLRIPGQKVKIPIEEFLKVENKVIRGSSANPPVFSRETFTPVAPFVNTCANCGAPYASGAAFCSSCGKPLNQPFGVCPGCGEKVAQGSVFCSACGRRV